MLRSTSGTRLLLALLTMLWPCAAAAAPLPTADAILQIHRSNKQQLSRLHLQLVHRYETTEASCRVAQQEAEKKEKILKHLSQTKPEDVVFFDADNKPIRGADAQRLLAAFVGAEYRQVFKREIEALRRQVKPFRLVRPMEFFLNGDDYQFRQPVNFQMSDDELKAWTFADAPLTAETLSTVYRDVGIFSRSAKSTPASRWWHHSADRHAYVMQKHLTEVWRATLPPFTDATEPKWDCRHPFDAFFSQPAGKYRVVRQEEIDGRLLTVVDVAVPIHPDSPNLLWYRGWLDLDRGALPMRMFHRQGTANAPKDLFDRRQPNEITTTQEVRELPGGAFYPAKTVREVWERDPDATELSEEELIEVRDGKRQMPVVVHRRDVWECSLVEIRTDFDDEFFVLPFPEGQTLFDHDAGKIIGALDPKPMVRVGQQAPPLTIARWLDGQQRTLDDLKGQVVVLEFWGLWCGACQSSLPTLKALQERFDGRPVTFLSIHTAEKDPQALAARIEEFKKANEWHAIGAIDAGRMIEDSVTTNAYGVVGFPMKVIVGPDGKIAYVDSQPEGPPCDEDDPALLADFESTCDKFWKSRFEAVGETWPGTEPLKDEDRETLYRRVELLFLARQIESALETR